MVRIYRSTDPNLDIPRCSIFSFIFSGEFDLNNLALTDAATGQTFTRNDVKTSALQLAWSLRNPLSLKRGDTVALLSMNSIVWPTVLLGAIAAGVRITTVNSMYTPSELSYQLEDSGAYYIFVQPQLLETAIEALKMTKADEPEIKKRIILVGPSASLTGIKGPWRRLDDFLGRGQLEKEEAFDGEAAHETILLCYSSGTTARSKGVELTHFNIVTVLVGIRHRSHYININKCDMAVLPFFHIYGLVAGILIPLLVSCPLVVMSQFAPEDFCAYIERYKVTVVSVVPPMLIVLANHSAVEKYSLKSLEVLISAAAPLKKDLILAASARLEKQGVHVQITQAWGLTETSPACTILDAEEWLTRAGSIGALLSNMEARIVLQDGSDAAVGEEGEMWFRGPNVMKGYLNNPKATHECITSDGWFKTGDTAYVNEDGYFFIVDRMKELIKYKGFQVPPSELEDVLLTNPNVLDAGVIGVYSDAEATELPRAYVVPRGGAASLKTSADKEAFCKEVQTWIQGKVARHKYLRGGVVVIDAVPKSAAGKILRKDLRELAKKESLPVELKGKL